MVHIDADTSTEPRVVRLRIQGQLDLEAVDVFGKALTRAARLHRPVELNLSGIDFIDGTGLSTLIDANRRARRMGHRLTIVDPSRCICRLVEITDTADSLPPLCAGQEGIQTKAEPEIFVRTADPVRAPAFRV